MVQNLYKKLTPNFKNHMRNLDNFTQAVKSPKGVDSMGYICPKNTFLQLKHHIQRIYETLLSAACVKIHNTTPVYFLAQTFHTFDKSSSLKCKDSGF